MPIRAQVKWQKVPLERRLTCRNAGRPFLLFRYHHLIFVNEHRILTSSNTNPVKMEKTNIRKQINIFKCLSLIISINIEFVLGKIKLGNK